MAQQEQQQQQEQVHERGQVHWDPSRARKGMGREDRPLGSYYLVNVVLLGVGGKQCPLTFSWMDCACIGVTQLCCCARLRLTEGTQSWEILKLHCPIGWPPAYALSSP